ncbi:Wound-induced protein 1 [Melia azedarach]|uniref:Wound-induced protein 1 n=1 Tax=Melia azedarach TaxID=155640 RepID=A0ACC1Y5U6_MELAZ|nr:Wound-induced protein 1 [Melia azedarach]
MCHSELANSQPQSQEEYNKWAVKTLYEALNSFDVETVHRLVIPDLEWWFHGPPIHQHLMQMLTGRSGNHNSFTFVPLSIAAFGSTVVVEGRSEEYSASWVHAWTVTNGIITQVREYFNTSVTVTRFGDAVAGPVSSQFVTVNCQSVWQSKLCDNNSVPGLVLAL